MLSINRRIKWEKYINLLEAIINQCRGNQTALVGFQPWKATLWFVLTDIQQPCEHPPMLHPPGVGLGTCRCPQRNLGRKGMEAARLLLLAAAISAQDSSDLAGLLVGLGCTKAYWAGGIGRDPPQRWDPPGL